MSSTAIKLREALQMTEVPRPTTEKEWADLYYSAKTAVSALEEAKEIIFGAFQNCGACDLHDPAAAAWLKKYENEI